MRGQELFPLGALVGVCPGSDHARSMLRTWNYLASQLPDSTFYLHGLCKQHATGLCLAPATVWFGFLCSLFCTIKLLHHGNFYQSYLEGLFLVIRASIVRWEHDDDIQLDPEHAAHAKRVLELCFYRRDLHALETSESELERQRLEKFQRLEKGRKVLRVCQGDWRSNHIFHWCTQEPKCCNNEAEATACVHKSVLDILGHAIPVPALNKWTQVYPAVASLSQGFCLHGLFPRALEFAHTLSVPLNAHDVADDDGGEEDNEAVEVGLPRDARKAISKEISSEQEKFDVDQEQRHSVPAVDMVMYIATRHAFALFSVQGCWRYWQDWSV